MSDEFDRIWKETTVACFKVLSWYSPGGKEEWHENLCENSRCPYQYSNRALPEYRPIELLLHRPAHFGSIACQSCNKLCLDEASNKQRR
jgi:hypothetical protein